MLNKLFALVLFTCLVCLNAGAAAQSAPSGWSDKRQNGARILQKGKIVIRIDDAQNLSGQSLSSWANSHKKSTVSGVKFIGMGDTPAHNKKDGYVLTRKVKVDGHNGASILAFCPRKNGRVQRIELYADYHTIGTQGEAYKQGVTYTVSACQHRGDTSADTKADRAKPRSAPARPAPAKVPTARISAGKTPSGLKDLRGLQVYGIQAGGMYGLTEDAIATFTDGNYTTDIAGVFNHGKAQSKRLKPRSWGHWKMRGKDMLLKDHNDKKFDKPIGSWVQQSGRNNHKLDGCYGRLVSSSGFGNLGSATVGRASSWCFRKDGRFAHSATGFAMSFGDGVRGAGHSSPPSQRGRYRIDGYAIHLIYDDGSDIMAGFSFLSKDRSHISINGRRFMG